MVNFGDEIIFIGNYKGVGLCDVYVCGRTIRDNEVFHNVLARKKFYPKYNKSLPTIEFFIFENEIKELNGKKYYHINIRKSEDRIEF